MMATLISLAALAHDRTSTTTLHPPKVPGNFGYDNKTAFLAKQRHYHTSILNDTENERMMVGQKQNYVRLPHGPNPHQHHINDMSTVIGKREYQILYQKNIRNCYMNTRHWLIDPVYNSPYNNYSSYHQSESCIPHISNYLTQQNHRKTTLEDAKKHSSGQ